MRPPNCWPAGAEVASQYQTGKNSMLLLGAHVSIAGGVEHAFARGEEVGCTAIQIFTSNASQWRARPISEASAAAFRRAWQQSPITSVMVHDSYLINLATGDADNLARSKAAFVEELQRCALLGIPALVMHPGAHLGAGEAAGLARVAESFRDIFAEAPAGVTVLLETTAGQGSSLGWRFEQLAEILERVPEGAFGVCFDTCHVFAAGYDLSSEAGYHQVMAEFDRTVGIERIMAFHLNDSKKGCGSRVDRHEHVGQGAIGAAGFRALMQDARVAGVPKILETPKGIEGVHDRRNLALLRRFAGEE
jgi:deoxyribonuclease-4